MVNRIQSQTGGKGKQQWANAFSTDKSVDGASAAQAQGQGQVQSSSTWGSARANAIGSEGTQTNSLFSASEDNWTKSFAKQKNGKASLAWKNNFANQYQSNSAANGATQGSGESGTIASAKIANGIATGTEGSAVDTAFQKSSHEWADTFAKHKKGNKSASFVNNFAITKSGDNTANAIGFGNSAANAKVSIKKATADATGDIASQGATTLNHSSDSWNQSWAKTAKPGQHKSFQNNFANKMSVQGGANGQAVGNSAVMMLTSAKQGSKAIAQGDNGSSTATQFAGNKEGWADTWAQGTGVRTKIKPIKINFNTAPGSPAPAPPAHEQASDLVPAEASPDQSVGSTKS